MGSPSNFSVHILPILALSKIEVFSWWSNKAEPENWRVEHLSFLQDYIGLEKETIQELQKVGLNYQDIFIFAVCLYLKDIKSYISKIEFKAILKDFAYTKQDTVEFRHDFAKQIWTVELKDGSDRYMADYHRVYDLLDRLSGFQYYILFMAVCDFANHIRLKVDIGHSRGLIGKTWQEMYSLQKEFSVKSIELSFKSFLNISN